MAKQKSTNTWNKERISLNTIAPQPLNLQLATDEQLLHIEEQALFNFSKGKAAVAFFLFLGFPLYAPVVLILVSGSIASVPVQRLFPLMQELLFGLLLPAVFFLLVGVSSVSAIGKLPRKNYVVVTDKRIFIASAPKNDLSDLSASTKGAILLETKYEDALSITTFKDKRRSGLKIKVNPKILTEDENSFDVRFYPATDAEAVYQKLPSSIRKNIGEKSAATAKALVEEKKNNLLGFVFGIVFMIGLVTITGGFVLQETSSVFVKLGKKAYWHEDYAESEKLCDIAYGYISKMKFHPQYGAVCFRLALASWKNGNSDKAIPLFKEAIEKCNWRDQDSGANWYPATCRSATYLAEIYASKGDTQKAAEYFEEARNRLHYETNIEEAQYLINAATKFFKEQRNEQKVHQFEIAGKTFRPAK